MSLRCQARIIKGMGKVKRGVAWLLGRCKHSVWLWLSGVLVGLCMVLYRSEGLLFWCLWPCFWYLLRVSRSWPKNRHRLPADLYVLGLIICFFGNFFILQVSAGNWTMNLSSWLAVWAPRLSLLLICLFCALSFWLIGWLLQHINNSWHRIASLVFLWPLAELLRSYLFAIMAYAPHGSLSPNFNWGALAVPAAGTDLVYASTLVGFFGLSAVVVAVNLGLWIFLQSAVGWVWHRFRPAVKNESTPLGPVSRVYILKLGMVLLATSGLLTLGGRSLFRHRFPAKTNDLKIVVVPLNEDQALNDWPESDWPPVGTDLLVTPEYSELMSNPRYKEILSRLSENGVAITTIRAGRSPGGTNQLVFLNRQGEVVERQDKTFLIPTGETLPYSLQISFRALHKSHTSQSFRYIQQVTAGKQPERPYDTGKFKVGALACSGVSALSEYSRLTKEGADVLVNSASLSFLQPDSFYHVYAGNMARFQAVSNSRPLAQASRSGQSYVIY